MTTLKKFGDTCEISSVKTGVTVKGEILSFREKDFIVATINRSAKVNLKWKEKVNLYVGSLGGVEFTSTGPKEHLYRTTR